MSVEMNIDEKPGRHWSDVVDHEPPHVPCNVGQWVRPTDRIKQYEILHDTGQQIGIVGAIDVDLDQGGLDVVNAHVTLIAFLTLHSKIVYMWPSTGKPGM